MKDLEWLQNRNLASGAPAGGEPGGGEPAGGGGGGEPPVPAAPAPTPYAQMVSTLPPEIRDHPSMADIKDFEGMAKTYVHGQSMLGKERTVIPGPNGTDDEWANFHASAGRPETAEAYQFPKILDADFMTQNGEFVSSMTSAFHSAGLSERQANTVVQSFLEGQNTLIEDHTAKAQEVAESTRTELRKDWGDAYDAKMESVNEAATEMFGDGLDAFRMLQLNDGSFVGDNPFMVRVLAALGDTLGEGGVPNTGGGSRMGVLTPEQAAAEYKTLEGDPKFMEAWLDRDHPQHDETIKRRMQLQQMMNPGQKQTGIMAPQLDVQ